MKKKSRPIVLTLTKAPTGIEGLDEITGGGLPRGRSTLIMGDAGSGKTVLALQTLVNGARLLKEPAIFVAFEEESRQIVANAAVFDWNMRALEERKLFFLDAMLPMEMVKVGSFDLNGLLSSLESKVRELGAKRIAFDGIDALLRLLDNSHAEHRELDRLQRWVRKMGLVGIFTTKTDSSRSLRENRFSFIQFMADCVIVLNQQPDPRTLHRSIRVAKYRGSSFYGNEFAMSFSSVGLEIMGLSPIKNQVKPSNERVSTGVSRLDSMLSGGVFRGASILMSGSPGTAKSTLCAAAALAACKRGEKVLFISFEEMSEDLVRNLNSVKISLRPHVKSGLLTMYTLRTEAGSTSEHFMKIRALVREHRPDVLVIDPISALIKVGGLANALQITQWLLRLTKSAGIIIFLTSLLEQSDGGIEDAALPISTIADCWIHLSYVSQGGERNRALTIVKARGTHHSNQARELVLSSSGVTLADVYLSGGDILMGSSRLEREAMDARKSAENEIGFEKKRKALLLTEASLQSQIKALEIELEAHRKEFKTLHQNKSESEEVNEEFLKELRRVKGADNR